MTHNTRVIDGVTCVEVHDSVFTDGELTEDTLDWFAQDKDGNVGTSARTRRNLRTASSPRSTAASWAAWTATSRALS